MAELDARLARIAAQQRMLVTLDDIRQEGGSSDHADARVDGGRLTRVHRGVYLMAGAALDWETKMLAAVLAAGPGAVASHLAAARLLGLPGYGKAGLELSIPRDRRFRRNGVRTHESTDIERSRVILRSGIPTTSPERTIVDLARYVGDQRLARDIEAARRAELLTWPALIEELARLARRGRPGVQRTRRAILTHAHREEITDSAFELLVLGLIVGSGLPEPVVHHRVHDRHGRFVAEVDLCWPHLKIAIECDGPAHLDPVVRARDLVRQNDLMLEGWTVLRFDYERVRDRTARVLDEIHTAYIAAQR